MKTRPLGFFRRMAGVLLTGVVALALTLPSSVAFGQDKAPPS